MSEQRARRYAELIKREISLILLGSVDDVRLKRFTLTRVEVTSDLKLVRVYLSFPGEAAEVAEKFEALQKAAKFIKNKLVGRIRIRYMPEILYFPDVFLEKASRVIDLLNQIEPQREESNPC
ncbi:MAG TPA: 30S ribosome-binding factor RbfA [Atribacteraceae bacterium]|nr:30S ribosome-binding factor RbfA [Atribacteraceae bacterium]